MFTNRTQCILRLSILLSLIWLTACANVTSKSSSFDVFDYVNQLIGTDNGGEQAIGVKVFLRSRQTANLGLGNVFAGASLPYGMAKAVADVDGQNTGGFATDGSNITGFSSMHDSGTGSQPSLGNFPIFPQAGCPGDDLNNCAFPKARRAIQPINGTLKASPGYFAITVNSSIRTEMTTSNHTALYRFEFPTEPVDGSPLSPLILLDLSDLWESRQNATITVDPATARMTGNGTFLPSFGSGYYVLHFCADFSGAPVRDTGIFVNDRAGSEPKSIFITRGINLFNLVGGGWARFKAPTVNNTITARVGVSFVSSAQACHNAEQEIPDFGFDKVRQNSEDAWRKKLSPVSIQAGGASTELQTIFYSGIYRNFMSPQDYTGENPLWKSTEPYFDSFYCIWDSFRAQHPLLTIVDPEAQSRMVRSLIDIYKHLGWLPDCRMSLCKGFTQGGSNADVVLTDAYVKKLPGIDWNSAYEAVVNDAENEPIDWSVEGRGGLQSWKSHNYIPAEDYDYLGFGTNSRSISRTVEYSYDDFCISTMAKGLGKTADFEKYAKRSENWQNIFKADQKSIINGSDSGFTGFFQPKYLNRTWGYQDPILCSPSLGGCSLTSDPQETFESSIWEYQFFVPQDMASLITTLGGPTAFTARLDYLHNSGLIYIGNEPSFLTVFQYHYAGRPALSAKRAHTYVPSQFSDSNAGLPGNDDSGALGAFTAFVMMGLFPNPGQNVYLITPPFFESVSVKSPLTGKTATIRNVGFDAAYNNIYVQSATLNGKPYTKNWIGHEFFTEGQTLVLTLGRNESEWGTRTADLPPSLSTSGNETVMGGNMSLFDMGRF